MIKVLVDSAADFNTDEIKNNDLLFVPLQVMIEDKNYQDGINLFKDDFYKMMMNTSEFPKTSQPSPLDFEKVFLQAKENNDEVICILLSSALSGTYQSALLAKNMVDYEKIYLIDSLSATIGIRIMVEKTISLIKEGKNVDEILGIIDNLKSKVKILAALDTLEYLAKGGRIPKSLALIGEMAKLKPIITVSLDGKVDVIGKQLGVNKTSSFIIKKLLESKIDDNYPIYTVESYGSANPDKFEKKLNSENIKFNQRHQIGPAIGAHVGPGAFGIVYVEK